MWVINLVVRAALIGWEGSSSREINCWKEYTDLVWTIFRLHNCGLSKKPHPQLTCRTLWGRAMGQVPTCLSTQFQHRVCASHLVPHYLRLSPKAWPKLLTIWCWEVVASSHTCSTQHGCDTKVRQACASLFPLLFRNSVSYSTNQRQGDLESRGQRPVMS